MVRRLAEDLQFRRALPITPIREVMGIGTVVGGLFFNPCFRFADDVLFFVQRELTGEHATPQEHEVRVQYIASAVIVDSSQFTEIEHILNYGRSHILDSIL